MYNKALKKQIKQMDEAADKLDKVLNKFNDSCFCKVGCDGVRRMKCPNCGTYATSVEPQEPFVCVCGWRSDKTNSRGV